MPYGYGGGRSSGPPGGGATSQGSGRDVGSRADRSPPTRDRHPPARKTYTPPPTKDRHPPARKTYTPPPRGGGADAIPVTKPKTPVTTGGASPFSYTRPLPNWATRYNVNRPKGPSVFDRFWKHRANTQLMKGKVSGPMIPGTDESTVPTYTHALGGYDWKQNFPNTPELLDKALTYGYQHITEIPRGIMNIDPTSSIYSDTGIIGSISNAVNKANIEAAKNIQGFTGEGISPAAMQKYKNWQALASGGIVNLFYGGMV